MARKGLQCTTSLHLCKLLKLHWWQHCNGDISFKICYKLCKWTAKHGQVSGKQREQRKVSSAWDFYFLKSSKGGWDDPNLPTKKENGNFRKARKKKCAANHCSPDFKMVVTYFRREKGLLFSFIPFHSTQPKRNKLLKIKFTPVFLNKLISDESKLKLRPGPQSYLWHFYSAITDNHTMVHVNIFKISKNLEHLMMSSVYPIHCKKEISLTSYILLFSELY